MFDIFELIFGLFGRQWRSVWTLLATIAAVVCIVKYVPNEPLALGLAIGLGLVGLTAAMVLKVRVDERRAD